MGLVIPETYLTWQEPVQARRYIQSDYFTLRHILTVFATLFLLGTGILVLRSWGNQPPDASSLLPQGNILAGMVAIAALITAGNHLHHWFTSAEIRLTEQGVAYQKMFMKRPTIWPYSKIKSFGVETLYLEQGTFKVLVLVNNSGKTWKLPIAESADINKVREIFIQRGIQAV